jgi:subtilisin family serine protease
LERIKVFSAFDLTMGSPNVIVGIIDSGTDWEHFDLGNGTDGFKNVDETMAWNFVTGNNNVITTNEHGTIVAIAVRLSILTIYDY